MAEKPAKAKLGDIPVRRQQMTAVADIMEKCGLVRRV